MHLPEQGGDQVVVTAEVFEEVDRTADSPLRVIQQLILAPDMCVEYLGRHPPTEEDAEGVRRHPRLDRAAVLLPLVEHKVRGIGDRKGRPPGDVVVLGPAKRRLYRERPGGHRVVDVVPE